MTTQSLRLQKTENHQVFKFKKLKPEFLGICV